MGVALQEEIKFRKKDGNIVWTLCSASPVYDENGHHISNLATHIDITNRKKLEEELALSEQLHNLMIMHLPNAAIHIMDRNFTYIQSGGSQLIKLGLTGEMIRGKTMFDVLPPEVTGVMKHAFLKALEGEESDCEIIINDFNLLNIFVPIYKQEGSVDNVLYLSIDMTNHRTAEKELIIAKEKLNLALENANIGVWDWDLKTNVFTWDSRLEKIFDFKPGTCTSYEAFEKCINDEDMHHFREAIKTTLKSGSQFETVFRTKTLANGESK
jgi:PAS domain-containing protein